MEGEGYLTYHSGTTYEGGFRAGQYHGRGVHRSVEGVETDGTWVDGVASGPALVLLASGERYEGELLQNERHGQGTYTYANGDVYTGGWEHGARHGGGRIAYARGGGYTGGWVLEAMEGLGEMHMADGRTAMGTWQANALIGECTLELPTGGQYIGEVQLTADRQIVPHGMGRAAASEPAEPDAPGFAGSSGSALFAHDEARLVAESLGWRTVLPGGAVRYDGSWEGGLPHGTGVAIYVDGSDYAGGFVRGLRAGEGLARHADGSEYSGGWRSGVPHGAGVAVDAEGDIVVRGWWESGELAGEATVHYTCGDEYVGGFDPHTWARLGHGSCAYADGIRRFEGRWLADQPHGVGTLRSSALLPIAAGCATFRKALGDATSPSVGDGAAGAVRLVRLQLRRRPHGGLHARSAVVTARLVPRVATTTLRTSAGRVVVRITPSASVVAGMPPRLVRLALGRTNDRGHPLVASLRSLPPPAVALLSHRVHHAAGSGFVANVDAEYSGDWVHGEMHGSGVLRLCASGDAIEALFERGVIAGHTVLTTADGERLEGTFAGLSLRGAPVVRAAAKRGDGGGVPASYSGGIDALLLEHSLRAGGPAMVERTGAGEATLPNGDRYTGEWRDNVPHGHGTQFVAETEETYVGSWLGGRRHGHGVLRSAALDEYVGDFRFGVRCGRGVQRHGATGDVLKGDGWADDVFGGEGTLTTGVGDVYVGGFVGSLREGRGRCDYADGSVYVGGWLAGLYDGEGTLVGVGGARCDGYWRRGEMVGAGRRVYDNGEVYEGEFARGMRHGRGEWRDEARGLRYTGGWADDLRDGDGIWTAATGETFEGTWRQDRLHGSSCRTVDAEGNRYEGAMDSGRRGGSEPADLSALQALLGQWRTMLASQASGSEEVTAAALAEFAPRFLKAEDTATLYGLGTLSRRFPDGEVYEGFFRDGLQTGPGIWLAPSDDAASGTSATLAAPRRVLRVSMGVEATGGVLVRISALETPSGEAVPAAPPERPRCVLGFFRGGSLSGVGMALHAGGVVHAGGFVGWLPSGYGARWSAEGAVVYRGQWESGLYHGQGELLTKPSLRDDTSREADTDGSDGDDDGPAKRAQRDAADGVAPAGIVPVIDAAGSRRRAHGGGGGGGGAANGPPLAAEVLYRGSFANGMRHGEGRAEYADGGSYEGGWRRDLPHGRGVLVAAAGPTGWATSRGGRPLGEGGSTYTGEVANGMRCGAGVLRLHASGDTLEGEWTDDGSLADVVFRYATGGTYEGDLDEQLRPHGEGRRVYPDGSTYVGSFRSGLRDGHGVGRDASGDEYDGSWREDAWHGRGTLRSADGAVYEGGFAVGVKCGHGLMRYADGSSYEGEWADDRYAGVGNLYHAAGERGADMHGGHWQGGLAHGHSIYSYASGARFDGVYAEGLRHGDGTLTLRDGTAIRGTWVHGQLRGECTLSYPDGSSCTLALEPAVPSAAAPELCVVASEVLDECEFTYTDGSVYSGEFALLEDVDKQVDGRSDGALNPMNGANRAHRASSDKGDKGVHGATGTSGRNGASGDGVVSVTPPSDSTDGLPPAATSLRYVPHGSGTLRTAAGAQLVGMFARGELAGEGRSTYPDGSRYEGAFTNGKRSGTGVCTYADGSVYKGAWQADERHGRGLHILPGGDMFSGQFVGDSPASSGTIIYAAGGSYDGELRSYRRHGWGVFQESVGYKFEGDWSYDERSGYGREVLENGDVYEGQFSADMRHGRGRLLTVRGEEYDGAWAYGKRDGQGVSIVLPLDEANRQRQRTSASLLVHRERHFMALRGPEAAGRQ